MHSMHICRMREWRSYLCSGGGRVQDTMWEDPFQDGRVLLSVRQQVPQVHGVPYRWIIVHKVCRRDGAKR